MANKFTRQRKKCKQIYPIVSSCALADTRMRTGAQARSKGAKNHTKSTRTKTLTLASMQHAHQNTHALTHARTHARAQSLGDGAWLQVRRVT